MHFSVECVAHGWTVTEPTTAKSVRWVVEARVCDAMWEGEHVATRVGSFMCSGHPLTATILFRTLSMQLSFSLVQERHAPSRQGWKRSFMVRSGTLLKLEQFRELWHYDRDGNRVNTSVRRSIPIVEGIRSGPAHGCAEVVQCETIW